jgi:hypothetical protein
MKPEITNEACTCRGTNAVAHDERAARRMVRECAEATAGKGGQ